MDKCQLLSLKTIRSLLFALAIIPVCAHSSETCTFRLSDYLNTGGILAGTGMILYMLAAPPTVIDIQGRQRILYCEAFKEIIFAGFLGFASQHALSFLYDIEIRYTFDR